ncbi:MAG: lamin tail domain-containing protein, partial [Saprospiraceae bacterium]
NYYLYRDDSGRFLPIIWDLNESFGRFSNTGGTPLMGTTGKQRMSHLLHENDADFPLIQKLLSVPTYKRMYLAHYKTILLENFANDAYYTTAESFKTLIDAAVQADDNKFFTYNNFLDNLDSDISGGGGGGPGGGGNNATPGIANLMDGRSDYLQGLSDFTATEPTISEITVATNNPIIGESVFITATISDGNAAYLGYRAEVGAPFTKVELFDDGAHQDGAANDGIYGGEITITNAFTEYYLYAENDNIGKFAPERAQHEFYTLTATTTNPTVGDLVINEFMASNDATEADQDGEFDDWIELYNNGTESIDLAGYYLSDDAEELTKWAFPAGTVIEPNGFLIIWADDDEEQAGLHATFKLSAAAEAVVLVDSDGETILDEVSYIEQTTDVSYGRFPNGTGNFQTMSPTFNATNSETTSTNDPLIATTEIKIFPNPAQEQITISATDKLASVSIYNLAGQQVLTNYPQGQVANIAIGQLAEGMYFVSAITIDGQIAITNRLIVSK